MSVRQSARRHRHRPAKPSLSFPLTPHNDGQRCKKIRGKLYFFGVRDDPDAALERYLRVATDLHAGREPRSPTLSADAVTVKQLCNHYLACQRRRSQSGEIGPRRFEDCRTALESLASFVGPGRLASDVSPDDFLRYRQKLLRTAVKHRGFCGHPSAPRPRPGFSRIVSHRRTFVSGSEGRRAPFACSLGMAFRTVRSVLFPPTSRRT